MGSSPGGPITFLARTSNPYGHGWTMVNLSVTNAAMIQNFAALGLLLGLIVLPTIVLVAVLSSKRLRGEDDWN